MSLYQQVSKVEALKQVSNPESSNHAQNLISLLIVTDCRQQTTVENLRWRSRRIVYKTTTRNRFQQSAMVYWLACSATMLGVDCSYLFVRVFGTNFSVEWECLLVGTTRLIEIENMPYSTLNTRVANCRTKSGATILLIYSQYNPILQF